MVCGFDQQTILRKFAWNGFLFIHLLQFTAVDALC